MRNVHIIFVFIFFSSVLIFIHCTNGNESSRKVDKPKDSIIGEHNYISSLENRYNWKTDSLDQKPLCIVLCDFTSSMEKESSKKFVQLKAEKLLHLAFNKYLIKFYTVTKDMDMPFFETGMLTTTQLKEKLGRIALRQAEPLFTDSIHQIIDIKKKDSLESSYIIQSIEKSITLFNQNDPDGVKHNRLVIMSDMLENGSSSIGRINLEDHSFKEDSVLISKYKPLSLSFSKLKNLTIDVVLYSQKINNLEQHIQFWNNVFNKMGYVGKVSFSPEFRM